ncbi:hypothetical protein [Sporosarcina koreensis]|uniref:hypothetical protein n=1 Tax=Sporosarcina koreensis TaxID=334735 RepID=UPI00075C036D|nr:hypothetical protein [Sporosarcina koreensis]
MTTTQTTTDFHEITLVKETACLMLKNGNELVDTTFINQIEFLSITHEELMNEVKALAAKNNINSYAINLNGGLQMTTATGEKLYKRYDTLDETDFSFETINEMKEWLAGFWHDNSDENITEEEHDELIAGIMASDEGELQDRLGGVGYAFDEQ